MSKDSGFCEHLLTLSSTPLLEVYKTVYLSAGALGPLPLEIRGDHLVSVLQALRSLLREVRQRKSTLDRRSLWDPKAGLQAIPDLEPREERPWWEGLG